MCCYMAEHSILPNSQARLHISVPRAALFASGFSPLQVRAYFELTALFTTAAWVLSSLLSSAPSPSSILNPRRTHRPAWTWRIGSSLRPSYLFALSTTQASSALLSPRPSVKYLGLATAMCLEIGLDTQVGQQEVQMV